MTSFRDIFAVPPLARGEAPGRVNLMGDHTDYNDGLVLPAPIPQFTRVEIAAVGTKTEAYSHVLKQRIAFDPLAGPLPDFSRFIGGCLRVLASRGIVLPALKFAVRSDVPVGVGLSSSAALEVATLRAVNQGFSLGFSNVEIAGLAWEAETRHAGVNCGIMDQMACAVATPGHMLFLDTRSRHSSVLPLPRDAEILVFDSGVTRSLADSGYNARRAECEAAAALLHVGSLRDVADWRAAETLPAPLAARVRHVVTENQRVQLALKAEVDTFGALMNASHASLRDDYDVSHPAVDALVSALQAAPGVFGARMTGAGFGGACIALVHPGGREPAVNAACDVSDKIRLITALSRAA